VAFGTVADVVKSCRETLKIMMPGGGYCFAPTHELQDNSPAENVLAMYETAATFGRY
jgi:uroporphyrinogen decarboxylase